MNASSLRSRVTGRLGLLLALVSCAAVLRPVTGVAAPSPVRVMILVAAAWQDPSGEWRGEGQPVLCNDAGVCLAVVGEGPVASAAATMALGLYPGLDLTKAYCLIAGIAGTPPYRANNDGYRLAIDNVWRVGTVFVQDVIGHWPAWQDGVTARPQER